MGGSTSSPQQLCHAVPPLPQHRSGQRYLAGPVPAHPGSVPQQLQCHGPGLQVAPVAAALMDLALLGHDLGLAMQTLPREWAV